MDIPTGESIFFSELHYKDVTGSPSKQWLEVLVPISYDWTTLAFAMYEFGPGGASLQHTVAYLNGTAPAATVVSQATLPGQVYGWRVLVLDLPGDLVRSSNGLDGVALVATCLDGRPSVTDFVCYGQPADGSNDSPVADSGLALGKGLLQG